ncbi:hypothetical protein CC1G_09379 [Coprinopsis cinerea okayama7|uniref:Uncharacterized protein n=1 Tax=Coprinopsis cinerea (strain Okayama-7 / 130 / ATCC MYA-4618 / FGSC 9003) TaxID=240176 RepID=A8NB19_COPC7|nr:hypothetical protein CC1G_09379 [Coprinopsis cinerea okayama7\|eukprot:XP_001832021.2 hypothetical protein CC1G_09379 [Coprinopsis cinerea okayama7\
MSYIERKAWDLHTERLAAEARELAKSCSGEDSDDDLNNGELDSYSEVSDSDGRKDAQGDYNAGSEFNNGKREEASCDEVNGSSASNNANTGDFPCSSPFVGPNHDIQNVSTPRTSQSSPRTPSTNHEIIPPSTEREVYMALQSSPLSYLRPRRQPRASSSPYSDGHAPTQHSPPQCNRAHHTPNQYLGSLSSDHDHPSTTQVPSILNVEPQSPYSPYTLHTDAPWAWDVRLRMYHIDTELQTVDASSRIILGQFRAYRRCLLAQRDRYHRLLVEGPDLHPLASDN